MSLTAQQLAEASTTMSAAERKLVMAFLSAEPGSATANHIAEALDELRDKPKKTRPTKAAAPSRPASGTADGYMSTDAVAEALGITTGALRQRVTQGTFPKPNKKARGPLPAEWRTSVVKQHVAKEG